MYRRILITGATGFVGNWLVPLLRQEFPEARLVPISRRRGINVDGLPAMSLDFDDPAILRDSVRKIAPHCVIHISGVSTIRHGRDTLLSISRAHLFQPVMLAEATLSASPGAVFLFASSAEVYGLSFRGNAKLSETAAPQPTTPYAGAKAAAEIALREMGLRGLRTIIARPFNHTGPGQSIEFVVPAFAQQIARIKAGLSEPVIRTGSLDGARDFLDVRDVCAAYIAAIRRAQVLAPGETINIASGKARPIGEVLRLLRRFGGTSARVESDTSRLRQNDIVTIHGDASKAKELLDWEPRIPFEGTLRDTLAFWEKAVAADAKQGSDAGKQS